jgi:hypothetical protein
MHTNASLTQLFHQQYICLIFIGLIWLATVTLCQPYKLDRSNRSAVLAAFCWVLLTGLSELIYNGNSAEANDGRMFTLQNKSGWALVVFSFFAAATPAVSLVVMYVRGQRKGSSATPDKNKGSSATPDKNNHASFEMKPSLSQKGGELPTGNGTRADEAPYQLMEDGDRRL